MEDKFKRRVWLEINLNTLRENFKKIQEVVQPCNVIGILKANAYGLGVKKIAQTLNEAGVAGYGVAELNEALQIVEMGKPVQILGNILPFEIPDAVNANIILPINDYNTAKLISAEAVKQKKRAECHFLIDTGMGRDGMHHAEAVDVISKCAGLPNIDFRGIYSHFPMAYRQGSEITETQVKIFYKILEALKTKGITFDKIHIANSDAINNFPFTFHNPFNTVRTGINLYGSFDNEGQRILKLKSVLTLKTKLILIRDLPAGMTLGYGCTYKLLKDTRIGTISAGYADGLPLALSNRGYVLINGTLCPILGRVSMDYVTVSLENVPNAKTGDEVICLGGEGPNSISMENWAQIKGTHAYEIICSFGSRVERRYVI